MSGCWIEYNYKHNHTHTKPLGDKIYTIMYCRCDHGVINTSAIASIRYMRTDCRAESEQSVELYDFDGVPRSDSRAMFEIALQAGPERYYVAVTAETQEIVSNLTGGLL